MMSDGDRCLTLCERTLEADVKEQIDRINKKLESTLTIILEHFKETDERIESIEKDIAQIKGGE